MGCLLAVEVVPAQVHVKASQLHCVNKSADFFGAQLFLVGDNQGQPLDLPNCLAPLLEELGEEGEITAPDVEVELFEEGQALHPVENALPLLPLWASAAPACDPQSLHFLAPPEDLFYVYLLLPLGL